MSPLPEVQSGSEDALYNIGAVSRMTGLSMATLRAWERRYNFPQLERTAGGHRLYSEQDVLHLRWVKARIDEGIGTSQAIQSLRYQEEHGRDQSLGSSETIASPISSPFPENAPQNSVYLARLLNALGENQLATADRVIGDALAAGSPEGVIQDLIVPAFSAVGEAWEQGDMHVAGEHLATNYLRQKLLGWMLNSPPPRNMPPVVLTCAPDEWHEGSLLIIGALLRRHGWPVAYLGQATPLPDLANLVESLNPSLIVGVAMIEQTARNLSEWPRYLPEAAASGKPAFGYGGRIFVQKTEWRDRVQGIYLGDTLDEGLNKIEELLQRSGRYSLWNAG